MPKPPDGAAAAHGSPVMVKRAPTASDATMSFANVAVGSAAPVRVVDKTQDLSLSDLSPYDDGSRKRRLWPAALGLGALLAVAGIGWFASSKARVLDEPSPAKPARPVASAPAERAASQPSAVAAPQPPAPEPPSEAARAAEAPAQAAADPGQQAAPEAPGQAAAAASANEAARADEPDPAQTAAEARAGALVGQAQALYKRRQLGPAKARYREALKLSPDNPAALAGLVQLAIRQRDGKQAVLLAKQLASAQPEEAGNLLLLGDAYKAAGKRKEAREAWQSAARKGSAAARARLKR